MTLIPEGNIDRHIDRVVRFMDGSDLGVKFAMISASAVVGNYDGSTQEIARRTLRSVSTVQNWAHGHWAYRELRANGNRKLVRKLWRELPPTHWWRAWDIHQAGYDALYYLTAAYQNGWSSRGMMAEWDKDKQAGHAPLQLRRAKISFFGLASELLKQSSRLTEDERQACLSVMDIFAEAE